jgi:hypothetical protein
VTSIPLLDALAALRFRGVEWGEADRPVLIADGRVLHVRDLDAVVRADAAYVVGLKQGDFDHLTRYLRADVLRFYDMQVPDLSSITRIGQLTTLMIEWNTKATSLEAVGNLSDLEVLSIINTPKMQDLGPIATLTRLHALEYSGGIWSKNVANSLESLGELPELEGLRLTNLRVLDGGLGPLARCRALRRLDVSNQFATADYAYLSVALAQTQCDMFAPYVLLDSPIGDKDVMVVGSGKPFLHSKKDADRLQRYVDEFRRQQERFAAGA